MPKFERPDHSAVDTLEGLRRLTRWWEVEGALNAGSWDPYMVDEPDEDGSYLRHREPVTDEVVFQLERAATAP